jgi:hypothetical protein
LVETYNSLTGKLGKEKKMPEYRKKKGNDTWHWCTNCSNWPTSDYDVSDSKPTSGELDNECRAKEKEGTCKTK